MTKSNFGEPLSKDEMGSLSGTMMYRLFIVVISCAISWFIFSGFAQTRQELDEVTVIASRTINSADGYTIDLRGDDISKGKTATDLLPFLPNISKENGTFKINGLKASQIYVDGVKLSDLSELSNISGEMIEKIQVKYLAGADQKSSLSGGVIMISLKRPTQGGYYGSISADAEWRQSCDFGNEGVRGMINYRYKGLSVYDNLYVGAYKTEENTQQTSIGDGFSTFITETTKSHGLNIRNRVSLVQQFNSGSHLGGSYLISYSRPHTTSFTDSGDPASSVIGKDNILLQEATLRFVQPLGQRGAKMELTADFLNRHSTGNDYFYLGDEEVSTVEDIDNINLWKVKTDFIYPYSRSLIWKFGASAQYISSTYTPSVIMENDRFRTSHIPTHTTGITPLVYASAQGRVWKLKYSIGVNGQINRISYEDRTAGIESTNTQWSISPTLQLMMPFGTKMDHAVMLSYKRTLSDIPYTAISSVMEWSDSYNYSVGNPNLRAQSADIVMAGLSLLRNKINITALYAYNHDRIYWQTFQSDIDPKVFYTMPVNINGQGTFGLGVEWVESPTKWWRFKLAGRMEITPENTTLAGVLYEKTRFKEYFYFNNSFRFGKGWGGMLNASFEPTYHSLDRTYYAVYDIMGQVYKNFLHGDLKVAIDFSPLGNRRKLDRSTGAEKVTIKYITPVQYIGLSLTWNFSGGKDVDVDVVDGIQDYHPTIDNK